MDDDTVVVFIAVGFTILFFGGIFLSVAGIFVCMAWSRTRQWQKEKARRNNASLRLDEAESLVRGGLSSNKVDGGDDAEQTDEEDLDPNDSEDEAELKKRREKEEDWLLTTKQKFGKEFKNCWSGASGTEERQKKEKEDRKKLAKAIVKEMARVERKKASKERRMMEKGEGAEGLPAYGSSL